MNVTKTCSVMAAILPFNRNRFHYNWHWNRDYASAGTRVPGCAVQEYEKFGELLFADC